jgi:uncharacterized protein
MHRCLTGALKVEALTVRVPGLPLSLNGCKIVQLSDFHFDGVRLSDRLLAEAIARTNEANPDLIVITGDFITYSPKPIHELALRLKSLQSRYGIYAVLGNHDILHPKAQSIVTQALTTSGIHVLWNDIAYPLGKELPLVGFAEVKSRQFDPALLDQLDAATPRIVLSHNPDTAAALKPWRVDLQLSGHTHGGQVVLPFLGALPAHQKSIRNLVPKCIRPWIPFLNHDYYRIVKHWEWSEGLHQVGQNYLYVNRGLGTYFPGRFACPPEVTVVTLEARE